MARLDDLAGVHDHRAVGVAGDDPHIVGDQDHRHAEPPLQVVEQGQDLGLDGDVERGGRLVGDQQFGLAGQRHGDHDPLAETAGQLVGVVVQALGRVRHAHEAQHFGRPVRVACVLGTRLWSTTLSAIWRPMFIVGLREVIGSWKTIPISLPRTERISSSVRVVSSWPSSRMEPPTIWPPVGQEAHYRVGHHGLAAAGLPDHAERLALARR